MSPMAKRVILWSVLGTVGTAAVAGAIVGLVLFFSADIREVTHTFLGLVRANRTDLAYEMTSAELRARVAPAGFAAYLEQNAPNIRRSRSEFINGFAGGSGGECMEIWLYEEASTVYLILVSENERWRVSLVTMNEPDLCDVD